MFAVRRVVYAPRFEMLSTQRMKASLDERKVKRWQIYDEKKHTVDMKDYEIMKLPRHLALNPGMARRAFLKDAIRIHGNKYVYSQAGYNGELHKILTIVCPFHGPFEMTVRRHIVHQAGCPMCADNVRMPVSDFLTKSNNAIRRLELANDILLQAKSVPAASPQISQETLDLLTAQQAELDSYNNDDEVLSSNGGDVKPASKSKKSESKNLMQKHAAETDELYDPWGEDSNRVGFPAETQTPAWAERAKATQVGSLKAMRKAIPDELQGTYYDTIVSADLTKEENALARPPADFAPTMGSHTDHGMSLYREKNELNIIAEAQGGRAFLRGEREAMKGSLDKGLTTFLEEVKKVLPNAKLSFDTSVYLGPHHKMEVTCHTHGLFTTTPSNLLVKKAGCPACDKAKKVEARQAALRKFKEKEALEASGN